MENKYLITSALPYINGVKHLGNLIGSLLPADVYSRYLRLQGRDVLYICATDEHGTPAELAALEANQEVAEFCAEQHLVHKDIYESFGLSFDYFGRSSSSQNHELTLHFAKTLQENGYVYEKTIHQLYSIADGRFLPDRYVQGTCPYCSYLKARGDQCDGCGKPLNPEELINPISTISGSTNLELRESKHLFLALSKLQPEVEAWVAKADNWPILAKSIAQKWLAEGLEDRCITRDLKWGFGVERPGFEDKVFYVWFDAPIEYIGATKEYFDSKNNPEGWKSWWWDVDNVSYTQFLAKDNVPFHAITWPATLIGSLEPWKRVDYIKSFNWLQFENQKFSTSNHTGVFLDDALKLLPADYWRYYLLSNAPESDDANFTWEGFSQCVNKDLVGIIGGYINRLYTFVDNNYDAIIPTKGELTGLELQLIKDLEEKAAEYTQSLEQLEYRKAIAAFRQLWILGNGYLQASEFWRLIKEDKSRCDTVVNFAINLSRLLALWSVPVIPFTSDTILEALSLSSASYWPQDIKSEINFFKGNESLQVPGLLFRRVTPEDIALWKAQF